MSELDALAAALGPLARRRVALGARTTYRVGGSAALYVEVGSPAVLERALGALEGTTAPFLVLGSGSNLLVADAGFPGVCVQLSGEFATARVGDSELVDAGGGLAYPVLARRCAALGLAGMGWAVGIPGTVGGAVAMNAGGHGCSTAERLVAADVVDLRTGASRRAGPGELALSYRHSNVAPDEIVTGARLALTHGDRAELEREITGIVAWRRANQPGGRNGGSVFTNPPGDAAGRLVEAAGLKGHRVGGAAVSAKHANFVQADASATADDVYRLICELRRLVAERTGVELSFELRLVGFDR